MSRRVLLLIVLPLSAIGGPGFGLPLNLTTGTVSQAGRVAKLERTLADANER